MAKFCTKCGNPVKGGEKFCTKCGNPLQADDNAAEAPRPEAVTYYETTMPAQQQPAQNQATVSMTMPSQGNQANPASYATKGAQQKNAAQDQHPTIQISPDPVSQGGQAYGTAVQQSNPNVRQAQTTPNQGASASSPSGGNAARSKVTYVRPASSGAHFQQPQPSGAMPNQQLPNNMGPQPVSPANMTNPNSFAQSKKPPQGEGSKKEAKPNQKKNMRPLIGAIAGGVVVIALIAIGIFTSGFGLFGSTSVKDNLDEYSWEELSLISQEISNAADEEEALGIAENYNLIGSDHKLDGSDTKSVELEDGTETSVTIAGFYHDEKTDGGKAGITFMFTDGLDEHVMDSKDTNSGGWEESEARSWLENVDMKQLPEDMQDVIVEVEKDTNNTGHTADANSVTSTSDRLWLLSEVEICGKIDWNDNSAANKILNSEGYQYQLFEDLGVDAEYADKSNDTLLRSYQGEPRAWWSRSPQPDATTRFYCINNQGKASEFFKSNTIRVLIPCFCL